MKVSKEIRAIWSDNYLRGDVEKIYADNSDHMNKEAIRVCVKEGEYVKEEVFAAVAKFYNQRIKDKKNQENSIIQNK